MKKRKPIKKEQATEILKDILEILGKLNIKNVCIGFNPGNFKFTLISIKD